MPKVVLPIFVFKRFATYPEDVEDSRKQGHHGLRSRRRPSQLSTTLWTNAANKRRLRRSRTISAMPCQCAHSFNAALLET